MSTSTHVLLPESHRIEPHGVVDVKPSDPSTVIDVTVKLPRKAALPPIDPNMPQILSAEELQAKYGAAAGDMELAAKTFEAYGLTVASKDQAARSLRLRGSIGDMEKAFDTRLFQFQTGDGTFRGRTGDLHVPKELTGKIEGVFGLDERRVVQKRRSGASPQAKKSVKVQGLLGSQLAKLYNFPPGDGAGQTIALFEFGGGFFTSDYQTFCNSAGIKTPPKVTPISVDGTSTTAHDGAEDEVMLDVDVVAGTCSKAAINVYFSSFDEQGWIDILDRAAKDKPTVISVSWCWAEDDTHTWTTAGIKAVDDKLHEVALMGITVCLSSGDDGSYAQINDGKAHVAFPPSSPNVLCVGGTQFEVANGQIADEVTWKEGDGRRADGGGSTGGGVSRIFPRPAWQNVEVMSVNPHAIDGRVLPDVAALSGAPGYFMVSDGKGEANGGTSAATPLWACLIALIAANLPQGKRLPFLTPILYKAHGTSTVGAIGSNDITSGDNITATVGGYRATKGFDAVTGWGTPDGHKLLAAIMDILP